MKQRDTFSPPVIGGSSLLAIFAIVTLCVFTLLSLSTVLAEKRLSEAAADSVIRYYDAELKAEETLANLRAGEITPENNRYTCAFPVSDHRYLLAEFENRDGQWLLIHRQVIAEAPPINTEPLPVWDGNLP